MDFSFYFGDKYKDLLTKQDPNMQTFSSLFSPQHDLPLDEPCPCSNLRQLKDPFATHPSEILNKILMSNDLFSFNKELTSTLCCDSHESIREDGVFFEFSPKHNQMLASTIPTNAMFSPLTKVLENLLGKRNIIPMDSIKPPALDIFLMPKKKSAIDGESDSILKKKPAIHAVGDNDINENIKMTPQFTNKSSVKKDLAKKKPDEDRKFDADPKLDHTSTEKSIHF
ncbi:hypothetical protein RR48_07909 [Papilio machaon]|uniref:Uncharacterized protein n=1 Tax=Papilio machaon TaxID=76193 RepID=A0A194QU56_PAPMA|nr:hypothetical protein RR48_07909 [Papilio machaon]